ncbi:AEC family transporter [Thermophilibacter provencensis]|uniref:AEC family transporter n=1 Tax=Thermophilibacter provencensis TaxID=1852386 RepID=A0ABT7V3Z9_9ACTN|nr:AEC family transporter [Thermophilibacter provencensis]MDM8271332.1 AEC family transporter [Thermophilibacter provencensis]
MDILTVIGSMGSLVLVTLIGYVAARAGFLTSEVRPKLSALIFNVTLPCTILASVGEVDSSAGAEQITWSFVLGTALFFVMLAAAALACLALRVSRDERPLYLFMGVLTNTGFIGFAVLESLFGGGSVFLGSIFIAVSNVFLYSIGVGVLTSAGEKNGEKDAAPTCSSRLAGVLKNVLNVPMVTSVIALVVFFSGVPLPGPVAQAVDMVGGATSPLAMMLVGLAIAEADLRRVLGSWRLWGFSAIRFLLVPAMCYLLLVPVVPDALSLGVFIVMLAMPTGSMAAAIASTYGRPGELLSQGTIVSTIASFVIVPVLMALMG